MVTKADIGDIVDQLRLSKNWSKKHLAAETGIEPGNLNRIISGKQEATLERLVAFATVFGVRVSDIVRMAELGQLEDPRKTALIRLVEQIPLDKVEGIFR